MTPADAQRAADQFEDAYRAVSRAMITLPDGRLCKVPLLECVSAAPMAGAQIMTASAGASTSVPAALQKIARKVAEHFAGRPEAFFYRLPHAGDWTCAMSGAGRLPCRVRLTGTERQEMQIEVGVRA